MNEVEVSEPLVNSVKSSDHVVVHFDFPQKHEKLAVKKASCRKCQSFYVAAFAKNIVAPINRDNPENVWNSVLVNEISYVYKNHPLKTKYVRNHTCLFFDDELRTMKRLRRKSEKAYRKKEIPKPKAGFLIQFWCISSCLPTRKVNTSKNVSLVKISVLIILYCQFLHYTERDFL